MLALLRQRNYSLLFWSGLLSQIGSYALIAALPYYVYATSHSVTASGTAVVSEIVPGVIFSTIGGVFADCLPRKLALATGNGLRGFAILPLLAVHGPSTIWIVYVVGFLDQTIAALGGPFGKAALPHVVHGEEIITANALFSAGSSTAVLLGSPIGGLLLEHAGLSSVVMVDAISFAIPTVAVLFINVPLEDRRQSRSSRGTPTRQMVADLVLGWQYVWTNRVVAGVFLVTITNLLATGIFAVGYVPFIRQLLHGSAEFYSWCLTLEGLSGIAGALMMGYASRLAGPRTLASGGLVSLGFMSVTVVLAARQDVALGSSLLLGPPSELIGASQNALLQVRTQDAYRGRVSGAYGTTWCATLLISTGTATLITDHLGIRTMLIGGSLILVLAGLGAMRLFPRNLLAGEP